MSKSPSDSASETPRYIRAAAVKVRYGNCSDMWITRRLHHDGFPQPVHFGSGERFFSVEALDQWDRAMIQRGVDASRPKPVPPSRPRKAVRP